MVLSVVDLNKVHPFGGPPPAAPTLVRDLSPFQKGHSVRKSFSKEKPPKEGWFSTSINIQIYKTFLIFLQITYLDSIL